MKSDFNQTTYLPDTTNDPPSCPSFFRYELFSMFSDSPFTRRILEEKLIRYMTQEKCKLKIRVVTTVNKMYSGCVNSVFGEHFTQLFREQFTQELHTLVVNFLYQ